MYIQQLSFCRYKLSELKEAMSTISLLQTQLDLKQSQVEDLQGLTDYLRQQKLQMSEDYAKEYTQSQLRIQQLQEGVETLQAVEASLQ